MKHQNMKRIVSLFLGATLSLSSLHAQDAEEKVVQAGFVFNGGMLSTSFKTNQIESDGLGSSFGVGMGLHYNFKPHIALYTGLEFNFQSFSYSPTAGNNFFYDYSDREIYLNKDDESNAEGTFRIATRKQKPIVLTIPTMLIFRTNFIGYFRYYGKFGLRTSFVINQTVNDEGTNFEGPSSQTEGASIEKMKAKNDLLFIRSAGGMAAGAEWNFIGTTSLFLEAGFYYTFTPLFSGNGKSDRNGSSLYNTIGNPYENNPRTYRSFKASQMLIEFKLGILF